MRGKEIQLVIIGAGPAGLSAAAEAARSGVETIVLDMNSQPGGQYYHLPAAGFQVVSPLGEIAHGMALAESASKAGAVIMQDAEVWGIYPADNGFLVTISGGSVERLRTRKLIIAGGAFERTVSFPGWTLPGVMTAGGVLSLLKNQRVLAGSSFLLSGSGPLQLSVAAHLLEAGADVKVVLEHRTFASLAQGWRLAGLLPQVWRQLTEGFDYLGVLRRHGVPLRTGWVVVRAEGREEVQSAVVARVDRRGCPIKGTEQVLDVDAICQGFGLVPATRLSRITGCEHAFHPRLHTYVPLRDEWLQTSVEGCFVVGDCMQISGKDAALVEGKLAAVAVGLQLGLLNDAQTDEKVRPLRQKLEKYQRYADIINELFAPLPGLWRLMEDDTVVCRCENVTLAQIKTAVLDGAVSVAGVKNHTRAGMGLCQGRMCWMNTAQVIANEAGISLEDASRHTVRPPVFPVTLGDLLEVDGG